MLNPQKINGLFLLFVLVFSHSVAANPTNDNELFDAYGDEEFISIATGRSQPIKRAPAVASIITAEDILEMGATDLDQVLETVPGLHVSYSHMAYYPIYTMRGIRSQFNPEILVLINGIPITNLFQGNRGIIWGGMPVNSIARIEVIRGPGSAVYGADAFSGVINITTKTSSDIKGNEVGARVGNFQSREAWFLRGNEKNGFKSAFTLEVQTTDGHSETIEIDAQTAFDSIFLTNASLAPDSVNLGRDAVEARLDLSKHNWRFRFGYQGRRNVQSGAGAAKALDPTSEHHSDRFNFDITYSDPNYSDNWGIETQFSFFDANQVNAKNLVLFPPGAVFGGAFPEGMIGNPEVFERQARLGMSLFFIGFDKHRLRLGTGVNYGDLYKITETRNFTLDAVGTPFPLGSLVDVSNTAPFIKTDDRINYYAFLQDEWSFMPDWGLTSGIRFDKYSDFGNTINPRLALVWQTSYNLTSKLLYGRAFRAPSFAQEFNINNPITLGNPDLDPEIIDTAELAFHYEPTNNVSTGFNLFYYRMKDIIRFVPDPIPATSSTAQNTGEQTGEGAEWEIDWKLSNKLSISGNYAYQRSIDKETDSDAGFAPRQQFYTRAKWNFLSSWQLTPQINWVADRKRSSGDLRPELDDYTTVDLTLRNQLINNGFSYALSVRNLFDEDAREPSSEPGAFGEGIINDLPLPGRNYYGELRYHF